MVRPVAFVVAALAALASPASAETPEQRQACTNDAFEFCPHAIPDRERVFACLIEKRTQISQLCVAGLAPYLPQEPVPVVAKKPARPAAKPAAKAAAKPAARPAAKPATRTAAKQQNGKPLKLSPTGR